jgi:uncharacterized DUF497 family protein
MEFEFDPAKNEANRFKHGVPLAFGERVFDDPRLSDLPSFRLISVRRSNASEQRDYDSHPG